MLRLVAGAHRPSPSRTVLGASTCCLVVFLTLALVAGREPPSALDHATRAWVLSTQHPQLTGPMAAVSTLGDRLGLISLIAAGTTLTWRRWRRWAVALPLAMLGAGALQLVAKWAVDRPRPSLAAWGFPSGHVLSLVVLLGLGVYLVWVAGAGRRARMLTGGAAVVTLSAVAWSRLYLEAHWLSDLAGGLTLGLAYLLGVIWLLERPFSPLWPDDRLAAWISRSAPRRRPFAPSSAAGSGRTSPITAAASLPPTTS